VRSKIERTLRSGGSIGGRKNLGNSKVRRAVRPLVVRSETERTLRTAIAGLAGGRKGLP